MKKILTLSAFIFLTAACSQNNMQGGMMSSDKCMQECMKKMQGQGMMQKQGMNQGGMMKDCPMMKEMMQKQNMGAAQPTPAPMPVPAQTLSAADHEKHHPK